MERFRRSLGVTIGLAVLAGVSSGIVAATPAAAVTCTQPRILVLSAFPAEMNDIIRAATLDQPQATIFAGKEFWFGQLNGKAVSMALTGIGPVNATATTEAAFELFKLTNGCISGVVFSGVAGAGVNPDGSHNRIGDVTVPSRWTQNDQGTWVSADSGLTTIAQSVAPSVTPTLESTAPAGDPACVCDVIHLQSPPVATFPYSPSIVFGGDGSTTDPFGGKAAPCLPHGGDLAGCEPCPVALGQHTDAQQFADNMVGNAGPAFVQGLIAPPPITPHDYVEYDEETAAVAQVATDPKHATPFLGIRGISDGSPDPLGLRNFPSFVGQFEVYKQLAADNASKLALAVIAKM